MRSYAKPSMYSKNLRSGRKAYNRSDYKLSNAGGKVADHPNKHIREALRYAVDHGWTIRKSGPRAHAWGVIYCSFGHRECWMAIYSTPRNPEAHARDIRRTVDRCPSESGRFHYV